MCARLRSARRLSMTPLVRDQPSWVVLCALYGQSASKFTAHWLDADNRRCSTSCVVHSVPVLERVTSACPAGMLDGSFGLQCTGRQG